MSINDNPRGIDVSKWQTRTPSLTGMDFLIARATIGTVKDSYYDMHIRNARAKGLVVGAYHFNWDTVPVADQVRAFLAAAGNVDLYALDVEGSNAFNHAQAEDFIRRVQATGRKIALYHSLSGFWDAGQDWNWVAYWSQDPPQNPPPIRWKIWQFGPINGIDGNIFNGSITDLQRLANKEPSEGPMAQLPITSTTPAIFDIPEGAKSYLPDGSGPDLIFNDTYLNRYSPYAVGLRRAYYANRDGKLVIRLVEGAANIRPVPAPEPAPDDTPYNDEDIAAAIETGMSQGITEGIKREAARIRALLGL